MAWFGNVSLGNFPDLAGAVNKLSESVKNIEKNFDSALGLEEKSSPDEASGLWPSTSDRKTLFDPVMSFMGHREDDSTNEALGKEETPEDPSSPEAHSRMSTDDASISGTIVNIYAGQESEDTIIKEKYSGTVVKEKDGTVTAEKDGGEPHITDIGPTVPEELDKVTAEAGDETEASLVQANKDISIISNMSVVDSALSSQEKDAAVAENSDESQSDISKTSSSHGARQTENIPPGVPFELHQTSDSQVMHQQTEIATEQLSDKVSLVRPDVLNNGHAVPETESPGAIAIDSIQSENCREDPDKHSHNSSSSEDQSRNFDSASREISVLSELVETGYHGEESEADRKEKAGTRINVSDSADPMIEVEKVKKEMKLMEAALQGAARQAQAKADEIARLMNENEHLKSSTEDLKRKSTDAEDALRDEYHQRVAAVERKVYALTRERDTLRREQNKKSDAAALLKEKDEIICQVMAEGEELSKKQAAQESTIRKLRAQIREFEEEKQRLNSRLQVEETKVESIKKDKAATEKLLQETIERNQAEVAAQKEFYTNSLNAAKEAEALAEARVNNEARIELEIRLKEASERESMLVQALEELRQTLSRTEEQAVSKEDMLQRDIDDIQMRYQASEMRYHELVTQVPDSTRPLLRQIEAIQEASARKEEAWAGVERALNSRLQEAEAKAAAAEEKERAMNERLSQSLSRITVLETQIACLRTEQTQLSRSLEKERQRASESRQEYLAAMEEAATQEGRCKQLEDEIKELRSKHKHGVLEERTKLELLEKELERERTARSELEKTASRQISFGTSQDYTSKFSNRSSENGNAPIRKLSSAASMGSLEESFVVQASLNSSDNFFSERRNSGDTTMSTYFLKSMTPSVFEAALRQKDGELTSYVSRLTSLESIRDSLSEELVKTTEQCEKLRVEAAVLPGIRAELEALRRRHSSALELMGERDEALEELRADIADLKEMYREQVDLLVNKIQVLSSSPVAA